jgi:multidrug efflux pump subunit AcrA (membrane-fusion protein)
MKYQIKPGDCFRRAVIAFIFSFALTAASCSRDTAAAPTKAQITLEPGVYDVDHPELFELAKAETRALPTELVANGTVNPDITRTIHVTSLGSGRVVDLKVRLGDSVRKGQTLLVISSTDLSSAAADYQKAQADEELSRKALARSQGTARRQAAATRTGLRRRRRACGLTMWTGEGPASRRRGEYYEVASQLRQTPGFREPICYLREPI